MEVERGHGGGGDIEVGGTEVGRTQGWRGGTGEGYTEVEGDTEVEGRGDTGGRRKEHRGGRRGGRR